MLTCASVGVCLHACVIVIVGALMCAQTRMHACLLVCVHDSPACCTPACMHALRADVGNVSCVVVLQEGNSPLPLPPTTRHTGI